MSLLLPAILLSIGLLAIGIACWTDPKLSGYRFAMGLFQVTLLSSVACVVYGAYTWLRLGKWQSISIHDALMYMTREGINLEFFIQPVAWKGIQNLSEQYLASNIGWSLFWLSIAFHWCWLTISEHDHRGSTR